MQTNVRSEQGPPPPRSLKSGMRPALHPVRPPPVLASEALRDELAPLEPARRASRYWDAGLAAGFALVGLAHLEGLGVTGESPSAAAVCFAAAVVMGAIASAPLRYLARAVVGALLGLTVVAIGLRGGGPLALLAAPGVSTRAVEGWRVLAATVLPAALLFRSHYRAFRVGRALILGAFALSIPYALHAAELLLAGHGTLPRAGAAIGLVAIVSSLFALAEAAPTTTATAWWSELLTASIALEVGLRFFYADAPAGSGALAFPLAALSLVLAASPMALGLFQVLACTYAHDARRVDVHAPPKEDSPEPHE